MMDTATAARAVGGSVIGAAVPFSRVTTDTRGLVPGDLFVALKGERFDGHDFVAQAQRSGAAAALVDRSRATSLDGNLIAVDDPLRSLAALATFWRSRFDIPVAVVTGSNGKTTTKEMIAADLSRGRGRRSAWRRRPATSTTRSGCRLPCWRCARRIGSRCSKSA